MHTAATICDGVDLEHDNVAFWKGFCKSLSCQFISLRIAEARGNDRTICDIGIGITGSKVFWVAATISFTWRIDPMNCKREIVGIPRILEQSDVMFSPEWRIDFGVIHRFNQNDIIRCAKNISVGMAARYWFTWITFEPYHLADTKFGQAAADLSLAVDSCS